MARRGSIFQPNHPVLIQILKNWDDAPRRVAIDWLSAMTGSTFQFGPFSVDPVDGQVRDATGVVKLGATARRLLRLLVCRAGEVVPKSDLIEAAWGHRPVGDNALHVQISALRRLLGEGAIATRSGQGYRFIAHPRAEPDAHPRAGPDAAARRLSTAGGGTSTDTTLFGRDRLLRQLTALVPRHRLVTLTGPGGVGKSRLLREAVDRLRPHFTGGTRTVDLAHTSDPAIVESLLGGALDVDLSERAAGLVCLAHAIADRRVLLVLDTAEHWRANLATLIPDMLAAAPGLSFAVTSRSLIGIEGEHKFAVPPLSSLPTNPSAAARRTAPGIALFAEAAALADPDFRLDDADLGCAALICDQLDGLPLAIRFIAAYAPTLGLPALQRRLADIIVADAAAPADGRHGTLRGAFEWGYGLLPAADRVLLRRLAVFADEFDLGAAETVAADATLPQSEIAGSLARLCRNAMVMRVPAAPAPRYRLLHTTRVFLLGHLALSHEAAAIRDRHAALAHSTAERAEAEWETTSDAAWLAKYASLLPDLREALDWLDASPEPDLRAVALTAVAWPLWREFSLHVEGRRHLRAALARLSPAVPALVELRVRQGLGALLLNTAELTACAEQFDRAVVLATLRNDRMALSRALIGHAYALLVLDRLDDCEAALARAQALMADLCCPRSQALAALTHFRLLAARGTYADALTVAENGVRFCVATGLDRARLFLEVHRNEILLELGRFDTAAALGRQLLGQEPSSALSGLLGSIHGNLTIACVADDHPDALHHAAQALRLLEPNNTQFWLFDHLALRLARIGRLEAAALLLGYADGLFAALDFPRPRTEQAAHRKTHDIVRQFLDPDLRESLHALGRHMPKVRAIAIALEA